jgi:hypothetical protein
MHPVYVLYALGTCHVCIFVVWCKLASFKSCYSFRAFLLCRTLFPKSLSNILPCVCMVVWQLRLRMYVYHLLWMSHSNVLPVCLLMYHRMYSETSLIQHSIGLEMNIGLGGCRIMEWLLAYFNMVTVPHEMVGLERMLDYRGVRLQRFHCTYTCTYVHLMSTSCKVLVYDQNCNK